MDEKDLIKRTRNSFKAGRTRAEILKGFQEKGYKIEYADRIVTKAKRPKRILTVFLLSFVIIALLSGYVFLFATHKIQLTNPLTGMVIAGSNLEEATNNPPINSSLDEIQITPEFISFLLNEIGVSEHLHRSFLNLEKPIINFKIGSEEFSSTIGKTIDTSHGLNVKADLQFNTDKETVIKALNSQNPREIVKTALASNDLTIKQYAPETELFSKGYKSLYEALK